MDTRDPHRGGDRRAVGRMSGWGVISIRVKDRPCRQIKDLPVSGQRVALRWRKRLFVPFLRLPATCRTPPA